VSRELGLQDKVKFKQMQVYDLAGMKRNFDLVLFMGVFYHLRYPMLALDIVTQKVNKLLVFQTLTMPGTETLFIDDLNMDERKTMLKKGWPVMGFIEQKLAGDPTNWWAPNHACILAMLRTCGLNAVVNPGHEIYIAQPDKTLTSVAQGWNKSEYLSATGKEWILELDVKLGNKH
jgi:tRNA (mo5U34)-methyltransferase